MTIRMFAVSLALILCSGVVESCVWERAPGPRVRAQTPPADADTASAKAPTTAAPAPFLVFEAMHIPDKPDLGPYGLRSVRLISAAALWPADMPRDEPQENRIRLAVRNAARHSDRLIFDIEQWRLFERDGALHPEVLQKFIQVADIAHSAAPEARIGFYGVLPQRTFWTPVQNRAAALQQWHDENQALMPLAQHVDAIYPSLYTLNDSADLWVRFAVANLQEARRYGKPVYAFVWHRFHPSVKDRAEQPLPADFWRLELETCRRYADGIVIWENTDQPWNADEPWWQQTLAFLKELPPADQ